MTRAALSLLLLLPGPASAASKDRAEPAFAKAEELIEAADYEGAQQALRAAELALDAKDPRRVRVHERLGAVFLRQDKVKDARDAFTRALQLAGTLKAADPAIGRAYAGMGLCLLRQDNKKFALKFFKRGLDFEPDEGTQLFLEDQIRELEGAPPAPLR